MNDKEALIALRDLAKGTYTLYAAIFLKTRRLMMAENIDRVAGNWPKLNDLYDQVQHRLASNPIDMVTPLQEMSSRNFTGAAINLSFQCKAMGGLLRKQILSHEHKNMDSDVIYYQMLQEATEHEINNAITLIDNPKAKMPPLSIKHYMPSFVVTRKDLIGQEGIVGVSSGRITQLMDREDHPFPRPFHKRGREEYWTIDSVEAWLQAEEKRKSN
jgi:hypothetical protein